MLLGLEEQSSEMDDLDDVDQDEAVPAYDPSLDPRIIEKAKGEAMRLGATSSS